jgi:uncharacterized protein involved in outer membrane biogenesis
MVSKKTRVSILLSLLFILLCLTAAINLIPVYLDLNTYKGLIEKRLSDYSGTSVSIGSIRFAIKNGIEVEFHNLSIKDEESVILSAGKIRTLIKITPLIKKKAVVMRNIYLENPDIFIKREWDGSLNISRIINRISAPPLEIKTEKVSGQPLYSFIRNWKLEIGNFLSSFSLQPLISDIKLNSGRVTFIDQLTEGQSAPLTVENLNIAIEKPLFRRTIQVEIKGNMPNEHHPPAFAEGRPAEFDFNGKIENISKNSSFVLRPSSFVLSDGHIKVNYLPISLFTNHLKRYLTSNSQEVFVKHNMKNMTLDSRLSTLDNFWLDADASLHGNLSEGFESAGDINFRATLPKKGAAALSDPLKPHHGSIKYKMGFGRDFIDFKDFRFQIEDLWLAGKGSVDWLTPPSSPPLEGGERGGAKMTFDISTSRFDIDKGKKYAGNILPHDVNKFFDDLIKGGDFEIKGIKFSGMIDQFTQLRNPSNFKLLSGTIAVNNLDMDIDSGNYRLRKLDGLLNLNDGELKFSKVTGEYKDCRIITMSGSITDILSSPILNLSVKGDADARKARLALLDFLPPRYRKDSAQAFMLEGGVIAADIKISGPIIKPVPFYIEGDAELKEVTFKHAKLKLPFKHMEGALHFSPDEVSIKKLSWNVGDSLFGLKGDVKRFDSERPFLDIDIHSMLNLSDAKGLGLSRIEGFSKAEGISELNLNIKGRAGDFAISQSLDLTNAAYSYDQWFEKNIGSSNIIKFRGRVNSNTVYIADMEVSFEKVNMAIKGKIMGSGVRGQGSGIFDNPRFILVLSTNEMAMADIVKFLVRVEDTNAEGAASLQLSAAGSLKELKDAKFKGRLSIRNAGFKLTYLPMPVRNLNAAADFTRSKIFIPSASGIVGDSPVRFSASIKELANPVIEFAMQASSVNIDGLFPASSKEDREDEEKKDTIFERITWRGKVAVTKGKLRGLPLESMMFNIYFNKDMMKIKNLLFKGFNGSYTGKGWIEWDKAEGMEFFLENKIINMNIENLYKRLPKAFHDLHGRINASCKITGKGKGAEEIKRSLKGNLSIAMHNGRINRFHILSKIFSLLNVYQIFKFKLPDLVTEGMPYNSIRAVFEIKNGIAYTEDILIDSDSMRITAVGELDIKNKQMDMTVGVQPFQTIDKIVSNIPLAGRILTGDKKALIVFYFMVDGDMSDPEVTAVPLESLGEGIFSVIKRLMLTPQELLSPKKGG